MATARVQTQAPEPAATKAPLTINRADQTLCNEASPSEIAHLLQDLEKHGEIIPIPLVDADTDNVDPDDLDDSLGEDDPELSLDDEDALDVDDPSDEATPVYGNGTLVQPDDLPQDGTADNFVFRVRIADGKATCRFNGIDGLAATPKTPRSKNILDYLYRRHSLLKALAQWLEESRQAFLCSGDPWDLGANAHVEGKESFVPVIANTGGTTQTKDKRTFLWDKLPTKTNPETFARYLSHVRLVWDDGQCDLKKILFSKDAKLAWAAQACLRRCLEYGAPLPERLDDDDPNLAQSLKDYCALAGVTYNSKLVELAQMHATGVLP